MLQHSEVERVLTPTNFEKYVGFQQTSKQQHPKSIGFFMEYVEEDWTLSIPKMSIEELHAEFHRRNLPLNHIFGNPSQTKVSLNITQHPVVCNLTLEQALASVEAILETFDKTNMIFGSAINRIAYRSRRGAGNVQFADSVYYKGSSPSDCPVIIVEHEQQYGVLKHPNFISYGYVLNNTLQPNG